MSSLLLRRRMMQSSQWRGFKYVLKDAYLSSDLDTGILMQKGGEPLRPFSILCSVRTNPWSQYICNVEIGATLAYNSTTRAGFVAYNSVRQWLTGNPRNIAFFFGIDEFNFSHFFKETDGRAFNYPLTYTPTNDVNLILKSGFDIEYFYVYDGYVTPQKMMEYVAKYG